MTWKIVSIITLFGYTWHKVPYSLNKKIYFNTFSSHVTRINTRKLLLEIAFNRFGPQRLGGFHWLSRIHLNLVHAGAVMWNSVFLEFMGIQCAWFGHLNVDRSRCISMRYLKRLPRTFRHNRSTRQNNAAMTRLNWFSAQKSHEALCFHATVGGVRQN